MTGISNQDWFVAFTKPAKEEIAKSNLVNQNFLVELPLYKSMKYIRGKWCEKIEPMFPRYIFFKPINQNHSIRPVRSTIGIIKTLIFSDKPATISQENLSKIIEISNQQINIQAEKLIPITSGDLVGIINGSFKGVEGIVSNVAQRRISVLIQILGREKEVEFDLQAIKKLNK